MTDAHVPPVPEGVENLAKQGIDVLIQDLAQQRRSGLQAVCSLHPGECQNPTGHQALDRSARGYGQIDTGAGDARAGRTGKAAIEPLADAMKDPKWETRYRAVEALGKLADEKALKPLVQGLQDSRDHVRYMAVKGLTDLEIPRQSIH